MGDRHETRRHLPVPRAGGSGQAGGCRRRPQQSTQVGLACRHSIGHCGWARHQRHHAAHGYVEAVHLALAGALHGRRRPWPDARQDATLAHCTAAGREETRHHREDSDRKAYQCHALERTQDGQGRRRKPSQRAACVGWGRPQAASRAYFQALERPEVCRESRRCRRPLHESAGARPGTVRR